MIVYQLNIRKKYIFFCKSMDLLISEYLILIIIIIIIIITKLEGPIILSHQALRMAKILSKSLHRNR